MTDNKITLWGDFTDEDDKMVHVRETAHGIFRAVVERDDYPEAPYDEMACPVFRLDRGWGSSALTSAPEHGAASWRNDGLPHDMDDVWQRCYETTGSTSGALDLVDRYLRVFHGGGAELISSTIHQGGDDYLVYDTRAMREHWGQTGERLETSDPSAEEWQAYIDGEVYVIWVEQAYDFDADGEPISWAQVGDGPVGGFYGDDWAAQAAIEELESTIDHLAADMLPINDNSEED